jgi:hypothetical protein
MFWKNWNKRVTWLGEDARPVDGHGSGLEKMRIDTQRWISISGGGGKVWERKSERMKREIEVCDWVERRCTKSSVINFSVCFYYKSQFGILFYFPRFVKLKVTV